MNIIDNLVRRLGVNKFTEKEKGSSYIGLYDTSVCTLNVGDEIINDSARKELISIFTDKQFIRCSTHDGTSSIGIGRLNMAKHRILCGTNILNGSIFLKTQWNIGLLDAIRMKDIVTLGVGWGTYDNFISPVTSYFYKKIFSDKYIHSARDEYTKEKLLSVGVKNVLNTSCPTMWKLTESHCKAIPEYKSEKVVCTLTDYREDKVNDELMLNILLDNYKEVAIWMQGSEDFSYFQSLNVDHDKIVIIPPNLISFDEFLLREKTDYVGTRLHAGIRALQHKRRTIIIGVDNRAIEKSKDFNLKVIQRENIGSSLDLSIKNSFKTDINIPVENIERWKDQFRSNK